MISQKVIYKSKTSRTKLYAFKNLLLKVIKNTIIVWLVLAADVTHCRALFSLAGHRLITGLQKQSRKLLNNSLTSYVSS